MTAPAGTVTFLRARADDAVRRVRDLRQRDDGSAEAYRRIRFAEIDAGLALGRVAEAESSDGVDDFRPASDRVATPTLPASSRARLAR